MKLERPSVLSIAGLDPSGGAGILADAKTFENCGVYGLGVATALTFQTDVEFLGVHWVPLSTINAQIGPLVERFEVQAVKIGLVENLDVLEDLVSALREHRRDIRIVWDPIVRASAGFEFHRDFERQQLKRILPRLTLITPNVSEVRRLAPGFSQTGAAEELSLLCPVLVKSELRKGDLICDRLWRDGKALELPVPHLDGGGKHGSGCVLSAALVAALARGQSLEAACEAAQQYVRAFLMSTSHRVGYHVASH